MNKDQFIPSVVDQEKQASVEVKKMGVGKQIRSKKCDRCLLLQHYVVTFARMLKHSHMVNQFNIMNKDAHKMAPSWNQEYGKYSKLIDELIKATQ